MKRSGFFWSRINAMMVVLKMRHCLDAGLDSAPVSGKDAPLCTRVCVAPYCWEAEPLTGEGYAEMGDSEKATQ